MKGVKILHSADLHLDNAFTASGFPYYIVEDRKKDLLNTFNRLITLAKAENIDLLLLAGDLFEEKFLTRDTVQYVNQQLTSLENTYVFILPGNHDPYYRIPYYQNFSWGKNITIFNNEYKSVYLKDLEVTIHGLGYAYQEEKRPLLESIKCKASSHINILMLHGSDVTKAPIKQSNYLPFDEFDLLESGFDYIALGHYHNYKVYNDKSSNPIAIYPGSPEPLGFDETGIHGVVLGEISKEKNDIQMIPIAHRQYYKLEIDISKCMDFSEVKKEIINKISDLYPNKSFFSIILTGNYSWEIGLSTEVLEEQLSRLCYYIRCKDDTIPKFDWNLTMEEGTLLSSFILEMQEKIKLEKDEHRRDILKRAFTIGFDILKGGGYQK